MFNIANLDFAAGLSNKKSLSSASRTRHMTKNINLLHSLATPALLCSLPSLSKQHAWRNTQSHTHNPFYSTEFVFSTSVQTSHNICRNDCTNYYFVSRCSWQFECQDKEMVLSPLIFVSILCGDEMIQCYFCLTNDVNKHEALTLRSSIPISPFCFPGITLCDITLCERACWIQFPFAPRKLLH